MTNRYHSLVLFSIVYRRVWRKISPSVEKLFLVALRCVTILQLRLSGELPFFPSSKTRRGEKKLNSAGSDSSAETVGPAAFSRRVDRYLATVSKLASCCIELQLQTVSDHVHSSLLSVSMRCASFVVRSNERQTCFHQSADLYPVYRASLRNPIVINRDSRYVRVWLENL